MRGCAVVDEVIGDLGPEHRSEFLVKCNDVAAISYIYPVLDLARPCAYPALGTRRQALKDKIVNSQRRTQCYENFNVPLGVSSNHFVGYDRTQRMPDYDAGVASDAADQTGLDLLTLA